MELVAVDLEELVTAVKDQRFASSLTYNMMGFGIQQRPALQQVKGELCRFLK
jgi:hypothetical protein